MKLEHSYSQDFVDQAKCKEPALNQIAKGASVVFAGRGPVRPRRPARRRKEKNVWGIGVDADQGYLGTHVLTSATKKVDVAVVQARSRTPGGRGANVPDGLQRDLHREERRRRLREDLHRGAAVVEEGDRVGPHADRDGQDQGDGSSRRPVVAASRSSWHLRGAGFETRPSRLPFSDAPVARRVCCSRALVLALAGAAGCGSDEEDERGGTTPTATDGRDADTAAESRRSASASSRTSAASTTAPSTSSRTRGSSAPKTELGVEGRVLVSRSNADYVPNLAHARPAGLRPRDRRRLPDGRRGRRRSRSGSRRSNFAIVDFSQEGADVEAAERARAALQGAGGRLPRRLSRGARRRGDGRLEADRSSVGGQKIPPVDRYIAGFQAGARRREPAVKTLNGYSQDFVDQAKCKEIALNQIARGSKVVFQVAGQCGLGALDAAKEQNVCGIGVDADQAFLGDHVLTSALKRVDVAVFQTIQAGRRTARSPAARTPSSTSRRAASASARSRPTCPGTSSRA